MLIFSYETKCLFRRHLGHFYTSNETDLWLRFYQHFERTPYILSGKVMISIWCFLWRPTIVVRLETCSNRCCFSLPGQHLFSATSFSSLSPFLLLYLFMYLFTTGTNIALSIYAGLHICIVHLQQSLSSGSLLRQVIHSSNLG